MKGLIWFSNPILLEVFDVAIWGVRNKKIN
jgi:hypothetical protein